MKKIAVFFVVLALLAVSSIASADSNGQVVANQDIVKNAGLAMSSAVGGRIAAITGPGSKGATTKASLDGNGNFNFALNAKDLGIASGDDVNQIGIWGLGAYTNFKSTASGAKYDADAYNVFVGVDWRATSDLLVGLAGGWGSLDLDKKWGTNGYIKTDDELTVMPYVAYNFTDDLIVDAAFAYSNGEYKDNDGTNTGTYTSNRYMTNVGLAYYYLVDQWTLSTRAGYMYVHGDLGSYSRGGVDVANPDAWLGQASLQAKAAYLFTNGFEPYAGLKYMVDLQTSSVPVGSDYDEFEGSLGVNWNVKSWVLSVEGGASMGRDDFESYRGQFFVRYEF